MNNDISMAKARHKAQNNALHKLWRPSYIANKKPTNIKVGSSASSWCTLTMEVISNWSKVNIKVGSSASWCT
jgi:hypothetical protein